MNSSDIKLIMPMAGLGSRFSERYSMPKPLVDAGGLPLFVRSVECIRVEFAQKIFLTAYQHQLTPKIREYYPDATIIEIDRTTEGTACTLQLCGFRSLPFWVSSPTCCPCKRSWQDARNCS